VSSLVIIYLFNKINFFFVKQQMIINFYHKRTQHQYFFLHFIKSYDAKHELIVNFPCYVLVDVDNKFGCGVFLKRDIM